MKKLKRAAKIVKKATKRSLKSKKTKLYLWANCRGGYGKQHYLGNRPPTSDNLGHLIASPNKGKAYSRSICGEVFVMLGIPSSAVRAGEVLELDVTVGAHVTYKCKVDITKKAVA